ncbi:MAG TPA: prepilin-type N-terminal cleavage/methylation domain-containing protein [Rhodocyclaceae bacterium]|jgi:prepilin-type N-terminal cleavage/methylation domain-containing protein|nr:prepilin-type N-terminal cleavage/methylation domain-containing protein [Rhodocyclaceae bacterium]
MRRHQTGFTLVEIAIVLVIIGLLLGGVLKGQELINSAKVKSLISDMRSTSTFVYAYQDRFRALPGDDGAADTHVNGGTLAAAANRASGRINGAWNSTTQTDESYLFWQHVRLAGFASGSAVVGSAEYIPRNADGGPIGITGDPVFTAAAGWAASYYVCSAGIQGRYVRQIDITIDDGNTTTGSVRVLGTQAGGTVASSATFYQVLPADDATLYTVCIAY